MALESVKTIEQFVARKRLQFYFKTDAQLADTTLTGLKQRRHILRPLFVPDVTRLCESFFQKTMKSVVPLSTGGTFHLLYTVIDQDNKQYIVRLNIPEFGEVAYEFLLDEWIYNLLGKNNLPTLQVHTFDLSRANFPFDYQIIEYATGQQLSLLQDPETQYLPESILISLGEILAQLHTIHLKKFGPIDLHSLQADVSGVHNQWKDYIFCNLDEHIATCLMIQAITHEQAERIIYLFEHFTPLLAINTSVLLHGDLGNHNIISDGKKVTALIDWEDCMAGDPIFDIAYWGTFFRDHFREQLLEGYCHNAQLPGDFEIRYWLYFLRISLSKTVHRHRFGYLDVPGRPPASSRIVRALDYLKIV